jgi:hypothetical protein
MLKLQPWFSTFAVTSALILSAIASFDKPLNSKLLCNAAV